MKSAIDRPVLPPSGRLTKSSRTRFQRAILHRGTLGSFGHSLLTASLRSRRLPRMDTSVCTWQMSSTSLAPLVGSEHFFQAVVSLFGAAGLALLFGVAILLIGLPIALVVRGVLEAAGWLFGVNVR